MHLPRLQFALRSTIKLIMGCFCLGEVVDRNFQPKVLSFEAFQIVVVGKMHLPTEQLLVPYLHHEAGLPKVHLYLVQAKAASLKLQQALSRL